MNTRVTASLVLLGVTLAGSAVAGGNSGAPDTELQIGAIKTYTHRHDAEQACGRDPVVWADRYAGYYYFPREPEFGHTALGAFACFHAARKSNYWGSGPMSSMGEGHGPGRQFPDRFPTPPPFGS